ncbi:hybrid sensor histidine kinase/response regulator [Shewanella surugensis]|uniref:histidine kinase n=1 Tax=Shewanella surugensis TaxID=212020 RepID=A0ABT0LGD5_9GAMM|nr:PAS domain-containing hybrid sensor histidine kinase/response regulator [Shewanella surugensis]MCL1126753.1 hybrid sensor histidine kinase/response regulator [Shewanella surugensis]
MKFTIIISATAILYALTLFLLAWGAERWFVNITKRMQVWIYALSLGVYCSSWSFLGTVGQSAEDLWSFLPVFVAPLFFFTFGFGLLRKIVVVTKTHNITSVADFIAARYGKSQVLAAIVTLIALFAIMPYIVLQLKAMVFGMSLFQQGEGLFETGTEALVITIILALFAILFGTQKLNATEHNPGMMLAIAFESLVKLVAFLLIGLIITFDVFDGVGDIWQNAVNRDVISQTDFNFMSLLPELFVGMAAFLCMPRQFHVMMVECGSEKTLVKARWLFPLYLILFALFVIPIALAGKSILGDAVSPDSYVVNLPLVLEHPSLSIIALLGTISAATGMVIVAVVTISVMVSNEWVVPIMLRTEQIKQKNFNHFSGLLLNARRLTIIFILGMGYVCYLALMDSRSLAGLGILSFGAFAQLAPALIGGMYWKHGNRGGVFVGLIVGFSVWFVILLQEAISTIGEQVLHFDLMAAIRPDATDISFALLANILGYILGSLWCRAGVVERMQASAFVTPGALKSPSTSKSTSITHQDLLMLASRFMSASEAYESFAQFSAEAVRSDARDKVAAPELVMKTELLLAGILGGSSAALVMESVVHGRDLAIDEVFNLVGDASSKIMLSQEMLRGAIEHAYEGMSVVDKDLSLVAWNDKYVKLYDYPDDFLQAGMPIAQVIHFNAVRGYCGEGNVEEQVSKRVNYMRQGSPHVSERERQDGRVIKVQGNSIPNGGFVMTFTDITQYREQARALQEMNETLETRVTARTHELSVLNSQLFKAKAEEEKANASKSRFLAAVGHDLMQPLNAARLFTASLSQDPQLNKDGKETLSHIGSSLKAAGELLVDLLDISKLDSGTIEVNRKDFVIKGLLSELAIEFEAMAADCAITFSYIPSSATVNSDPHLLRRVLQNFLTNAYRYAKGGRVILGCRQRHNALEIQVIDTGCGIADSDLHNIFREFKRLNNPETKQVSGLGLGLAIADRISRVLNHKIHVDSQLSVGSLFSICIPLGLPVVKPSVSVTPSLMQPLAGVRVLCIDNEETILAGLKSLLTRWQCDVICAISFEEAKQRLDSIGTAPDIILSDYHLDDGKNGVDAMDGIRSLYGGSIPGILITANTQKDLIEDVHQRGYEFMAKMVKPAALKVLMSSLIKSH